MLERQQFLRFFPLLANAVVGRQRAAKCGSKKKREEDSSLAARLAADLRTNPARAVVRAAGQINY